MPRAFLARKRKYIGLFDADRSENSIEEDFDEEEVEELSCVAKSVQFSTKDTLVGGNLARSNKRGAIPKPDEGCRRSTRQVITKQMKDFVTASSARSKSVSAGRNERRKSSTVISKQFKSSTSLPFEHSQSSKGTSKATAIAQDMFVADTVGSQDNTEHPSAEEHEENGTQINECTQDDDAHNAQSVCNQQSIHAQGNTGQSSVSTNKAAPGVLNTTSYTKKLAPAQHVEDTKRLQAGTKATPPVIEVYMQDEQGYNLPQYECVYCGRVFKKRYLLKRHFPIHTGEKNHSCSVCGKSFKSGSTLSRHKAAHREDRWYNCKTCGKEFNRQSTLVAHEVTHKEKKTFECTICKTAFHQKVNLKYHVMTHTGEKPYKCQQCNKSFTQQSNLKQHMFRTHKSVADDTHKCFLCDEKFNKYKDLRKHELHEHYSVIKEKLSKPTMISRPGGSEFVTKNHDKTDISEGTIEFGADDDDDDEEESPIAPARDNSKQNVDYTEPVTSYIPEIKQVANKKDIKAWTPSIGKMSNTTTSNAFSTSATSSSNVHLPTFDTKNASFGQQKGSKTISTHKQTMISRPGGSEFTTKNLDKTDISEGTVEFGDDDEEEEEESPTAPAQDHRKQNVDYTEPVTNSIPEVMQVENKKDSTQTEMNADNISNISGELRTIGKNAEGEMVALLKMKNGQNMLVKLETIGEAWTPSIGKMSNTTTSNESSTSATSSPNVHLPTFDTTDASFGQQKGSKTISTHSASSPKDISPFADQPAVGATGQNMNNIQSRGKLVENKQYPVSVNQSKFTQSVCKGMQQVKATLAEHTPKEDIENVRSVAASTEAALFGPDNSSVLSLLSQALQNCVSSVPGDFCDTTAAPINSMLPIAPIDDPDVIVPPVSIDAEQRNAFSSHFVGSHQTLNLDNAVMSQNDNNMPVKNAEFDQPHVVHTQKMTREKTKTTTSVLNPFMHTFTLAKQKAKLTNMSMFKKRGLECSQSDNIGQLSVCSTKDHSKVVVNDEDHALLDTGEFADNLMSNTQRMFNILQGSTDSQPTPTTRGIRDKLPDRLISCIRKDDQAMFQTMSKFCQPKQCTKSRKHVSESNINVPLLPPKAASSSFSQIYSNYAPTRNVSTDSASRDDVSSIFTGRRSESMCDATNDISIRQTAIAVPYANIGIPMVNPQGTIVSNFQDTPPMLSYETSVTQAAFPTLPPSAPLSASQNVNEPGSSYMFLFPAEVQNSESAGTI